jgi:uncharacterized membrane protein YdjX (TVP38/TMEM64 family)
MVFRVALAISVVGLLVGAWTTGLTDQIHPATIERSVRSAGPLGPMLYVVAFSLGLLVHMPAFLFFLAAAVIWPLPSAIATAYAGALTAALFVVFVARFALSDLARRHLLHRLPERLRGLDERLGEEGLREIVLLRFVTFMLPAAHWVLGVSRARARDVVLGTAIGLFPGVVLSVVVGQALTEHWEFWRPYVLGAAAVLLIVHLVRRRRRSLAPSADA